MFSAPLSTTPIFDRGLAELLTSPIRKSLLGFSIALLFITQGAHATEWRSSALEGLVIDRQYYAEELGRVVGIARKQASATAAAVRLADELLSVADELLSVETAAHELGVELTVDVNAQNDLHGSPADKLRSARLRQFRVVKAEEALALLDRAIQPFELAPTFSVFVGEEDAPVDEHPVDHDSDVLLNVTAAVENLGGEMRKFQLFRQDATVPLALAAIDSFCDGTEDCAKALEHVVLPVISGQQLGQMTDTLVKLFSVRSQATSSSVSIRNGFTNLPDVQLIIACKTAGELRLSPMSWLPSLIESDGSFQVSHDGEGSTRASVTAVGAFIPIDFLLDEFARPNMIDVGAGLGAWSIVAAHNYQVQAHAFEPNPLICESLLDTIQRSNMSKQITANCAAISNYSGTGILYVHRSNLRLVSSLTMAEPVENTWAESAINISVAVTSIDAYVQQLEIRSLALLKLDAEYLGYEVLEGASETLQHLRPYVYCRQHGTRQRLISSLMARKGYTEFAAVGWNLDERLISSPSWMFDQFSLFVPNERKLMLIDWVHVGGLTSSPVVRVGLMLTGTDKDCDLKYPTIRIFINGEDVGIHWPTLLLQGTLGPLVAHHVVNSSIYRLIRNVTAIASCNGHVLIQRTRLSNECEEVRTNGATSENRFEDALLLKCLQPKPRMMRTIWFVGDSVSREVFFAARRLLRPDLAEVSRAERKLRCGRGSMGHPKDQACGGDCTCSEQISPTIRLVFVFQQWLFESRLRIALLGQGTDQHARTGA